MTSPAAFFADVAPDAQVASARTGVPVSVILAQWANETGFGTSRAWLEGNNYAGVSPGGSIADYSSRAEGLAAYISTLNLGYYSAVRSAGDPLSAARALEASPWAESHYGGNGLEQIMNEYNLGRFDDPNATNAPTGDPGIVFGGGGGGSSSSGPAATLTGLIPNPFSWGADQVKKVAVWGIFLAGGAALVVIGAYRGVAPAVSAVKDRAEKVATAAAVVA